MSPDFTVEELRQSLGVDRPIEGAVTVKQVAKMLNICITTARTKLNEAVKEGTWRKVRTLEPNELGHQRSVAGYIMLKGEKVEEIVSD